MRRNFGRVVAGSGDVPFELEECLEEGTHGAQTRLSAGLCRHRGLNKVHALGRALGVLVLLIDANRVFIFEPWRLWRDHKRSQIFLHMFISKQGMRTWSEVRGLVVISVTLTHCAMHSCPAPGHSALLLKTHSLYSGATTSPRAASTGVLSGTKRLTTEVILKFIVALLNRG